MKKRATTIGPWRRRQGDDTASIAATGIDTKELPATTSESTRQSYDRKSSTHPRFPPYSKKLVPERRDRNVREDSETTFADNYRRSTTLESAVDVGSNQFVTFAVDVDDFD